MFVMVVVALAVVAMARLSVTTSGTLSLSIQQARAYQAARAGLEWGIRRAVKEGDCAASTSLALAGNLSDFSNVVVSCNLVKYPERENGKTLTLYTLTAVAQNAASPSARPDYAYRELRAKVETDAN
ncbi:hypothetical protein NA645_18520 [Pseudomonas stutzeri]|uniref:hypothetical protein n=1 Tax=Stutzerimonas stutzeri TaxID=316 RepID=UPI00210AFFFE|nr:hypothetical protein [Stutzerimonas stutzeri]MCQ4309994.1 hypothetical protein [Stutzerimonas stutzeri]